MAWKVISGREVDMVAALMVVLALAAADGTTQIDPKWAWHPQASQPAAGLANPGPVGAGPPAPLRPNWTRAPAGDDMSTYYPDRAQREGLNGRAVIDCTVTDDGHLDNCTAISEEPANYGFGDAALKLAHLFKMKPQMANGAPVGGARIKVPIRFVAPAGPAPLPAEPADQRPMGVPEE